MALQALSVYPDSVRLVYHHYPEFSQFSYTICEALEAAGEQDKFWEMHDRIFTSVPENRADLDAIAEELDLDLEQFNEALDSRKFRQTVIQAKDEAKYDRGVMDVALFINGKEYIKYSEFEEFSSAIDEELERVQSNDGN